jgi:hypothetical protein
MSAPAKVSAMALLIGYIFVTISFLTGCSTFGSPQVCLKTDYGTFCYQLPELPAPTSSK